MASDGRTVQTSLGGIDKRAEEDEESELEPRNEHDSQECPLRWELYEEGLNDREIADKVGISKSAVGSWRRSRGLPPNYSPSDKKSFPRRRELYEEGLNDREIADKVGISASTVGSWRSIRGLPSNRTSYPPLSSNLLKDFIEDCKARLEETTVKTRRSRLKKFEWYMNNELGKSVEEVKKVKDVRKFLNYLKNEENLARSTISGYLSSIREFYKYVEIFCDEISDVPDLKVLSAKDYRREEWEGMGREPLARKEVDDLIRAPEPIRDRLIIAMLYYTGGSRAGAIAKLKKKNVDRDNKMVKLREKGNQRLKVPYDVRIDRLIDLYLDTRKSYVNSGSEYFFVSKHGKKLSINAIWSIVSKAAKKAGIQEVVYEKPDGTKIYKVKPHVLRHSFVTHAAEDGVPLEDVIRLTGHKDLQTLVDIYLKKSNEAAFKSFREDFKGT